MNHADILKLLFPAEIVGECEADIETEGAQLDAVQTSAEDVLNEMFADVTYRLLTSYERAYGLTPEDGDPLQVRRRALLRKMREIGGLSRAYFIGIAASYGIEITIDEFMPFMCGWNRAGDSLAPEEVIWLWQVNAPETTEYYFRAGESVAGERLGWWMAGILEAIFEELKPAHTKILFTYGS